MNSVLPVTNTNTERVCFPEHRLKIESTSDFTRVEVSFVPILTSPHSTTTTPVPRSLCSTEGPARLECALDCSAPQSFHPQSRFTDSTDASQSNKENDSLNDMIWHAESEDKNAGRFHKKFRLLKNYQRQFKRLLRIPVSATAPVTESVVAHPEASASSGEECQRCQFNTTLLRDLQSKYSELTNEVSFLHHRLVSVQHAFTSLRTMLLASFPPRCDSDTTNSVFYETLNSISPLDVNGHGATSDGSNTAQTVRDHVPHDPHVSIADSSHSSVSYPENTTKFSTASSSGEQLSYLTPLHVHSGHPIPANIPLSSLQSLSVHCNSDDDRAETVSLPCTDVLEPPMPTAQLASLIVERTAGLNLNNRALTRLLGLPSGRKLSDLLHNPKPWYRLSRRARVAYHCMYKWLVNNPVDRPASLKENSDSPLSSLPPPSLLSTDTSCTQSAQDDFLSFDPEPPDLRSRGSASICDLCASPGSSVSLRSTGDAGNIERCTISSPFTAITTTTVSNPRITSPSTKCVTSTVNHHTSRNPTPAELETQRRICNILNAARQAMLQERSSSTASSDDYTLPWVKKRKRSSGTESSKQSREDLKTGDSQEPVLENFRRCTDRVSSDHELKDRNEAFKSDATRCAESISLPVVMSIPVERGTSLPNVCPIQCSFGPTVLPPTTPPIGLVIPQAILRNPQLSELVSLLTAHATGTGNLLRPSVVTNEASSILADSVPTTLLPNYSQNISVPTTLLPPPNVLSVTSPSRSCGPLSNVDFDTTQLSTVVPASNNVILSAHPNALLVAAAALNATRPANSGTHLCPPKTTGVLSELAAQLSQPNDPPSYSVPCQFPRNPLTSVANATQSGAALSTAKDDRADITDCAEASSDPLALLVEHIAPLDTNELVRQTKNYLREFNISQRAFGETVLNMSQASVSDILNKPRDWSSLSLRCRLTYLRLYLWLQQHAGVTGSIQLSEQLQRGPDPGPFGSSEIAGRFDLVGSEASSYSSGAYDCDVATTRKREHSGLTGDPIVGTPSKHAKLDALQCSSDVNQPYDQLSDLERQSLFDIAKAATVAMQRANSFGGAKCGKARSVTDSPAKSTSSSKPNTPLKGDPLLSQFDYDNKSNNELTVKFSPGRNRSVFTQEQKDALVASFNREPYPNPDHLRQLANLLNLSYKSVLNWFHNRRMRSRNPRTPNYPTRSVNPFPVENGSTLLITSPMKNVRQVFESASANPVKSEPDLTTLCSASQQSGHSNRRKRPDPSRLVAPRL